MEESVSQNGQEQTQVPIENSDQKDRHDIPENQLSEKSEIDLLKEKTTELTKQSEQYKDQFLRKAAEFENYKRRTETESINFAKYASENIITQLLPVLDDFARSLKSSKDLPGSSHAGKLESDPFYKGVEMIFNKFMKLLELQGLKTMDVIGKEFNVDFHDALMQMPRSDVAPHTIIEEVEKGYLLYDKVIRHAKVIVSTSAVKEEVKN
jgi:molecular chaperone GrpE